MKAIFLWLPFAIYAASCSTMQAPVEVQKVSRFVHFVDLADALRAEPGLKVAGTGRNVTVRLMRGIVEDNRPIFFINGIDMGQNYNHANDALQMHMVRSIRVSKRLSERSEFGRGSPGGIIEIWTY